MALFYPYDFFAGMKFGKIVRSEISVNGLDPI